jgi:hypothetical protein
MFWKKKENSQQLKVDFSKSRVVISEKITIMAELSYPRPKILLIDLKDDSESVLKQAGYKIEAGTFGTIFRVEPNSGYLPLNVTANLPNYTEQEIVVIDLIPDEISDVPNVKKSVEGEDDFWGKSNLGVIDTRPIAMYLCCNAFDKILSHNGVFIIFADYHTPYEIIYAKNLGYHGLDTIQKGFSNWSFLTILDNSHFRTKPESGSEITVVNTNTELGKLLNRYVSNAHFTCTLYPATLQSPGGNVIGYSDRGKESWIVTATNKYKAPVAGVFTPDKNKDGWVFIFPQIENKSGFLHEFLRDVLPELVPELFPYSESSQWINKDEYQSSLILEKKREIEKVEENAKQRVDEIKEEIKREQEKIEYQNNLLTETNDSLVKAVKKSLEVLGFERVIDVDEELAKQGINNSKNEDLQILDEPVTVLIEVKGVTGFPTDSDTLQITKHVPIRMKQWNRTNVKGLTIINHQRAISAIQRVHNQVFRDLLVTSAEEQDLGLLTTFDLYRLVRSFVQNNWKHENIKDLFVQSGRIEPIPSHYEYVGKIENFWEKVGVAGIRVEDKAIRLGDVIAFELALQFEEVTVNSLQVENQSVEIAGTSTLAGIKTELTKDILKKGIRVYRVMI